MPNTQNRAYPYPSLTSPPNGPDAIQALAAAVDADVTRVITDLKAGTIATATGANNTPQFAGGNPYKDSVNKPGCTWIVSRTPGSVITISGVLEFSNAVNDQGNQRLFFGQNRGLLPPPFIGGPYGSVSIPGVFTGKLFYDGSIWFIGDSSGNPISQGWNANQAWYFNATYHGNP